MKNLLIKYKGGGYDGCIWEWNLALYDSQGKFHNIYATGHAGRKTHAAILQLFKERAAECHKDDIYIHDLTKQDSWNEFAKESNPGLVVSVVDYIANCNNEVEQPDIDLNLYCMECGTPLAAWYDNYYLDGILGCGGIASVYTELLCETCHSAGICTICDEYYGETNLLNGICNYCESNYKCECCGDVSTDVFAGKCPSCWDDPEHTPQTIETITTILDRVPGINYIQTHNHRVKFGPDIKHLNNVITTAQSHRGVDNFHLVNYDNYNNGGRTSGRFETTAGQISDIILQLLNK